MTSGKVDVASLFCTGTPVSNPLPLGIQRKQLMVSEQSSAGEENSRSPSIVLLYTSLIIYYAY